MTIIALTGHRSEDCEYEPTVRRKLRQVYEDFGSISVVICGMANGVDLWGADEALGKGLEVWAAKPWAGHGPRKGDEALYQRVLDAATRVVNVDESLRFPGNDCYQKRNIWMVDHADRVLAYYNGKGFGGTYNCIQYAENDAKPPRKVRNVYGDF